MKTQLIFAVALFSTVASATCPNFAGNYEERQCDQKNILFEGFASRTDGLLKIDQNGCSSLTVSFQTKDYKGDLLNKSIVIDLEKADSVKIKSNSLIVKNADTDAYAEAAWLIPYIGVKRESSTLSLQSDGLTLKLQRNISYFRIENFYPRSYKGQSSCEFVRL